MQLSPGESRTRKLWATSQYIHYRVRIYINSDPRFGAQYDGECQWIAKRHAFEIDIAEETFRDSRFFEQTLCHEMVHIIEQQFHHSELSAKLLKAEDCSWMAQAVGFGLTQMRTLLRPWPGFGTERKASSRKARKRSK